MKILTDAHPKNEPVAMHKQKNEGKNTRHLQKASYLYHKPRYLSISKKKWYFLNTYNINVNVVFLVLYILFFLFQKGELLYTMFFFCSFFSGKRNGLD